MEHADTVDPAGRFRCFFFPWRATLADTSPPPAPSARTILLTPERIREAIAAAGMDERLADHTPHGAIRWRAESDKQGFLFVSPINAAVRAEIDLYLRRCALGEAPLLPSPSADGTPVRREMGMRWLKRAEQLAGLPKLRGGTFHPFQRLWATERKPMPDVDVAAAGGWKDTQALRLSYQHADAATVLRVVEGA